MNCELLKTMIHLQSARLIPITAGLLLMFASVNLSAVAPDKQPQRVRFERGKSSATVKGQIAGFDVQDYVVGARAGQQMDIRIKASNPATYFVLYSINGKPTDMNETDQYSLETSEPGDYVIRVFMMRAAARRKNATSNYTLTISIK